MRNTWATLQATPSLLVLQDYAKWQMLLMENVTISTTACDYCVTTIQEGEGGGGWAQAAFPCGGSDGDPQKEKLTHTHPKTIYVKLNEFTLNSLYLILGNKQLKTKRLMTLTTVFSFKQITFPLCIFLQKELYALFTKNNLRFQCIIWGEAGS